MSETPAAGIASPALTRARIAVCATFFIYGFAMAIWAVHIPTVSGRLSLDPAVLGLALLGIGGGGVIGQPLAAWLVGRFGSRLTAQALLPLILVAELLPIFAFSTPMLFCGTVLFGFVGGSLNVAINTQASEIEAARGKPIMSFFHAFYSLGGFAGAGAGALILSLGVEDGPGAVVILAVLVVATFVTGRFYLVVPLGTRLAPAAPAAGAGHVGRFVLPVAVLGLAAIALLSGMIEGAVGDWSALYLTTIRSLDAPAAASGFAIYSAMMTICRLGGGPVVAFFGTRNIVIAGGTLTALGMALVLFLPWPDLSPFGFAVVALGAANTIPVLISTAGRTSDVAATGVAATSTGALAGQLLGPPIIGFVAQFAGLPVGLGLLVVAGLLVSMLAALYRWPVPARLSAA